MVPGGSERGIRIGIDVGGTFTDVVAIDEVRGTRQVLKVPSTPDDPSDGVRGGLDALLDGHAALPAAATFLGHGTTAGTNAFLVKRGARTALLTTAGFTDVLQFRRMDRSGDLDPYDLQVEPPPALVPGRLRHGVVERVDRTGQVVTPLTPDEIDRAVAAVTACGAEAVAVSLLWSFVNPSHEQRLRDAILTRLPDVFVTCSHEIDPTIMEYERTSTTVVNAYLGPLIDTYLGRFAARARERGLPEPRIMQSNGGLASVHAARRTPVALLESGPAGGVAACTHLATQAGLGDVFATDMGGTSFDVALIVDGEPQRHVETEIDGHAIRRPMLDIRSIGAGGGSIAWVDVGGALRVGPMSAGASPGPACYGRGGDRPTVSDASAYLGYLGALAGGDLEVDVGRAEAALGTHVATPLGLTVEEAAAGAFRIVNAHMADLMRVIAGERAMRPADLTLVAYGGAGPVHAASLARELGMARTVVPLNPGTLSALGVATADLVHDFSRAVLAPLDAVEPDHLRDDLAGMVAEATALLLGEGLPAARHALEPYVVARYIGQMHDLEVAVTAEEMGDLADVAERFHARHEQAYGFAVRSEPVFVTTVRLRAFGRVDKPELRAVPSAGRPRPSGTVSAWFEDTGRVTCDLYERAAWSPHERRAGPAVIREYDSTTVVLPGQTWSTDDLGSLVIEEER